MDPQIIEELCQYHMELWNWLAETGCKHKNLWPRWKCPEVRELRDRFMTIEMNKCFACYNEINCAECFISWGVHNPHPKTVTTCTINRAHYYKWMNTRSITCRKKYALIIAEAFRPEYAVVKPKRNKITKCQRIVDYLNQTEIQGFFLDTAELVEQVVRFAQDNIDSVCYGTPLAEDIRQLIATTSDKQLRRHCGRAYRLIMRRGEMR